MAAAVFGLGLCAGCESPSVGIAPPSDGLFFPVGLALDPKPDPGDPQGAPRYLFVTNANSDRAYAGSTVVAVDLRAFWDAWYDPALDAPDPYCREDVGRCVQPPGAPVDATYPCRHLAQAPQVVECEEAPFVVDAVRVGHFAARVAVSLEPDGDVATGRRRLWVPVRGDPSIVYVDVVEGAEGIRLECAQDPDAAHGGPAPCGDEHRLTHVLDDPDEPRLAREPFNVLVAEGPDYRYAFVAHATGGALTRIDLGDADRKPRIVEQLFVLDTGNTASGGIGLALRPCFEAGQGPLGPADPEPNVPALSKGCERPVVYAALRYAPRIAMFTVTPLAPEEIGAATGLRALSYFSPGGLDPGASFGGAFLGDIAFADVRGDRLVAVQTQPGALLSVDTSLDDDGVPANVPAGPPVELCQQPTTLAIHDDGIDRLAFVTCFRSAHLFVVDLDSMQVVSETLVGAGPHAVAVDEAREVVYVSNSLEATISVVDISRSRPTRFDVIAKLGLEEPFSQ
ncbi:MAG: hypothetical protein D6705_04330 [Deltaproteobacteria bacterium]|nr:MAG: hypothetical protein D6705_04330 [Deltaproteobacteria bacterium]